MIVLFNFNTYIGGGETLFVRFVEFLKINKYDFHAFCKSNSFIFHEFKRISIPIAYYSVIEDDCDYYYLSENNRRSLLTTISSLLPIRDTYRFVSFCFRDLYTVIDLNKQCSGSISHLILHNQDYLYVCQTLFDKCVCRLFGNRVFNNLESKTANLNILHLVNAHKGLIPMSWIVVKLWEREMNLLISEDRIIPLPAFSEQNDVIGTELKFDKTIIWIGRLVDFKYAALFAIFDFIRDNPSYKLTVVGGGDTKLMLNYIRKKLIPLDRIQFVGEIAYSELPNMIKKHSIGYATGTSIIEISKNRIPVVMALLNNHHRAFKKQICGGLFYNTSKGNIGEDLCIYDESEVQCTIKDVISQIENNYELSAQQCFEYTKTEYDMNVNFSRYVELINKSEILSTNNLVIPKSSLLRKLIYKYFR